MNNSEVIRKVLKEFRKNEMIFASKLYRKKLYNLNVSESSFYKLLERMYKAEEIEKLSKGIYYFPKKSKYGVIPISNEEIISVFTSNDEGMVVGYNLYNKLNLTTQISKKYSIYSSNTSCEVKNIGNVEIKNVNMKFKKEYVVMIEMFEVLQNFNEIQELDYSMFLKYISNFSKSYNDKIADEVIFNMKYKKATISFLNEILNFYNVKNNLNKYLSSMSKYNHLTMEEIYELARTQE